MTEKRFECMVDRTIWDNKEDINLSPSEYTDLLNTQHETIQKQQRIIQKQEKALAEIQNSRYQCAFCHCIGFLSETFVRWKE